MIETDQKREKFILVAASSDSEESMRQSLCELKELVKTAGADTADMVTQSRESIHPGTYVGKGKLDEIQSLVVMLDADGIVCDDELSPAQLHNLSAFLQCKVMDRTLVILDIFAKRAASSEGKIQVELAQLRYRASRLSGLGTTLSRQGGGIGTRGPGEKKLETDRRTILNRITSLKKELEEVKNHREILRAGRRKKNLVSFAIVGYTNAGKSTLLNTLTGSNVLEEDELFATLDPTTRILTLPDDQEVFLTDTVGFIHKLPHHLIEAFKSTLEEAVIADHIIHVVDASDPQWEAHMKTVYETLDMLKVKDKKILTLFNKIDQCENEEIYTDKRADVLLKTSARSGQGLDALKEALEKILVEGKLFIDRVYPYDQAGKIAIIRNKGKLIKEEYTDTGIHVEAYVPMEIYDLIECGV